jgi:hypothetical protein
LEIEMATRRKFLALIGGGVVLAAAAGGTWAATRDPAEARRPWEMAGQDESEPRRLALSYALLAPNPHNRQPWLADLSVPDQVTLFCQEDRKLPHTDPFDRQITIGLGAFIELAVMAAGEMGYRVDVTLFPEGEPQPRLDQRPVARLVFAKDAAMKPDPLFAQVHERRSNKEPFDMERPVPADTPAEIAKVVRAGKVGHSVDPAVVAELRALAWQAMQTELLTPATLKESVDLMRIGRAEIEANPDGIAISGPLVEALALTGLLSREAMLDPASTAFQQQLDALKPQFDTAMAFLWLVTPGNDRANQIAAGRDYVRLNLAATGSGIAMHPFSQALQEYPEMQQHYAAMRESLGIGEGETLQMFVRLGYGPDVKGAPRWPLENRIRST